MRKVKCNFSAWCKNGECIHHEAHKAQAGMFSDSPCTQEHDCSEMGVIVRCKETEDILEPARGEAALAPA